MPAATKRKSTNEEMEKRVEATLQLLASGIHDFQVRAKLREQFGQISRNTCNRLFARARALMRKRSGKSREELVIESDAWYRRELEHVDDPRVRLELRRRIDDLHGLDAKYTAAPKHDVIVDNRNFKVYLGFNPDAIFDGAAIAAPIPDLSFPAAAPPIPIAPVSAPAASESNEEKEASHGR